MPYCPKCRNEFQDWVETCPDCNVALVKQLPTPPTKPEREHYELLGRWNYTDVKAWVLFAMIPAGVILYGLTYILGAVIREVIRHSWPLDTYTVLPPSLVVLGVIVGTFILHEYAHGLAFLRFGGKPRFGVKLIHRFFPVFYTTSKGFFRRNDYIKIGLAPILSLTTIFLVIIVVSSDYRIVSIFLMAMAFNIAGAVGDMWIAWKVWKYETDTLFEDTLDGFNWYSAKQDFTS